MADPPMVTDDQAVTVLVPTAPAVGVNPALNSVVVTPDGSVIITHNGVGIGARLTPDQMVGLALILGNLGARKIRAEEAADPVMVAFPEVAGHA
jgi:hypothetical protein